MEVKVVRRVLDANETMAQENRQSFAEKGVFVFNLMSSPGSGKTTMLVETLKRLGKEIPTAVIVGDICTTNDADRLAQTGVEVVQINTDQFGGDCHLGAHVIRRACQDINLDAVDLLIVENVGNLVCPAEFDMGEDRKGVVLSVTEGEDKPLKYPLMFRVCDMAVLSKIDLLPHLDYDKDLAVKNINTVNPNIPVFCLSTRTGEGFDAWMEWLKNQVAAKKKS
ncbi:MAG: hydrogenase nickel incorporation protein HypB [Desulfatibacillaceae bacterium]|nr:hydrogenase nickel incorporation protein HypB [Desulfatibacillaceae bacterium]